MAFTSKLASAAVVKRSQELSGLTANAYATVVERNAPRGALGVGILKNTHAANVLTAKLSTIDSLGGTVEYVEKDVAGLAEIAIDFSSKAFGGTDFTSARPPYSYFKLEVKSKVGGAHATFKSVVTSAGGL